MVRASPVLDPTPGHVAIVVPCHNEERRLMGETFLAHAARHPWLHFTFVNDGSSDGTGTLLAALCERSPGRLSLLDLKSNQGKAEAVRRGVLSALEAGPAWVGYWDADLATPLEAIEDLLAAAPEGSSVELAMGSRVRLLGRDIRRRAMRHYAGRVFATAASLTLGIPVYDTQCGAKLFRVTETTPALFAEPFRSRWIFDVELIARRLAGTTAAERARVGELIVEVPLRQWHDVKGSKVRPLDLVVAMWELVVIAYRYRRRHATPL